MLAQSHTRTKSLRRGMLCELYHLIFEHEIIRRYVIINTFDGALTILGIITASWLAGVNTPQLLILPSLGAGIAMCISGIWGAYAAESAELQRQVKALEKHLLHRLRNTHIVRENKKMAIIVGAVDGLSPLIATLLILIPFFLAKAGMIAMTAAYAVSIGITTLVLSLLGAFAGSIAHESVFKHVLRMMFAGIIVALVFFLLFYVGLL